MTVDARVAFTEDQMNELQILRAGSYHPTNMQVSFSTELLEEPYQSAFERLRDRGWLVLVDIMTLPNRPGKIYRVFRVSPACLSWLELWRTRQ